jgi:hypothetical protein
MHFIPWCSPETNNADVIPVERWIFMLISFNSRKALLVEQDPIEIEFLDNIYSAQRMG